MIGSKSIVASSRSGSSELPLSIYVHIPWCVKKCPYCDFNSHAVGGSIPEQAYVEQLLHDAKRDLEWVAGRPIQSVFIGGGTPSLFSPESYKQLLGQFKQLAVFAPEQVEITMEANPGALEYGDLKGYLDAGINRISFGVQSLNLSQLRSIGRIHTANEAMVAVQAAKDAGFKSINVDLMFGLPGQSIEGALSDLRQIIEMNVQHISWYELTIEQNTEFYRRPPKLPDSDEVFEVWEAGQQLLSSAGYHQYEVSAYAKSGCQSKHNLNYWLFGDYLGIGAGAHGKISFGSNEVVRTQKTRLPKDYLGFEFSPESLGRKRVRSFERRLSDNELIVEFMMNALRLNDGFAAELFERRTGLCYSFVEPVIKNALDQGLLVKRSDNIQCTYFGRMHLNRILDQFLDLP